MRGQHLTPQDRIGIREGGGNVERAEAAWEMLISLLHGSGNSGVGSRCFGQMTVSHVCAAEIQE